MFAGVLVNRVGTFVAPFLVLYLTGERGLSPALAGGAFAAWGAGGLVATPLAGTAADRFGRRITLLTCMLGAAGAMTLLGAARAPWLIVVAAALCGATADSFRPASHAIVADIVAPEQRPRAYAMTFWATNMGFCIAALTGGVLAAQGWWLLFAADAATCATFGLLIFTRLPETRPQRAPDEEPGTFAGALRDRMLLVIAVLFLIQGALLFQAFSLLPLSMQADGLSPGAYGAVIAVNGVIIVLLQPYLAHRLRTRSRARVLAGALAVMGLGLWTTVLADRPAAFAASVVVWTFGEIGFAAVSLAVVADLAPIHVRGRYTSVATAASGLAFAISPLAGSALYETSGEGAAWAACGALGLIGATIALAAEAPLRRRLTKI